VGLDEPVELGLDTGGDDGVQHRFEALLEVPVVRLLLELQVSAVVKQHAERLYKVNEFSTKKEYMITG